MKKLFVIAGLTLSCTLGQAATVFDVDLFGGITSENFTTGRGSVGARATVWGNLIDKSYENFGFYASAEADKWNQLKCVNYLQKAGAGKIR